MLFDIFLFETAKIGNLLKYQPEFSLFAEIFFQSQNLVHPSLVASALKLGVEESVYHHAGKSCADNSAAEAKDVCVVMQFGIFCAEAVGAAGSADSFYLVGSHRDADAGSAD